MPDTTHTPTPWRVDPSEGRILAEDPRQTIVIPSLGGSFSNPDVAADAAFIVRAVNAHDDLVAALRQTRIELEEASKLLAGTGLNGMASIYAQAAERVGAALTKAEA